MRNDQSSSQTTTCAHASEWPRRLHSVRQDLVKARPAYTRECDESRAPIGGFPRLRITRDSWLWRPRGPQSNREVGRARCEQRLVRMETRVIDPLRVSPM